MPSVDPVNEEERPRAAEGERGSRGSAAGAVGDGGSDVGIASHVPPAADDDARTGGAGGNTNAAEGRVPAPAPAPAPRKRTLATNLRKPFGRTWLRWLTILLTTWIALGVSLAGGNEISESYDLSTADGLIAGFAQGITLCLALWRPGRAWALSLTATFITAMIARPHLAELPAPAPAPNWPWSTPEVIAHAGVLLLLALRVPTRRAVAALAVSALATFALQGQSGGTKYSGTGAAAVAVFAIAVVVGTALRGRKEARTQLVVQETLTAEERAHRTLLEERSRIARELHDVVAHHMSVISIQAQVAPTSSRTRPTS